MTTTATAIGATAASHVALKLAAGGLAAALTVGGAAAFTGNLPDGAQSFAADAAAHIGLDLPRPDATINGSLDLSLGDIVTVGGAGRLGVTLDGDNLQLGGIEANAGFTARVVTSTADTVIVEFASAAETTTVLLNTLEGELVSSVTTTLHGSADAAAEADADAKANAEADGGAEADAKANAEAEADGGATITIGG